MSSSKEGKAEENPAQQSTMERVVPQESPPESNQEVNEKLPEQKPEQKQPSKLKQRWQGLGLDFMTVASMFKGSLPPTIAIAMYQANSVSTYFGTIGYLVAISSILGFCIMPRGKFIQTMTLNIISVCFACAVNLLALFCVTKAREHTTPPDLPPEPVLFNSTASTVAAIWLIVQVYIINSIKSSRPAMMFPAIICSIFTVVSLTYGTRFPNTAYAIGFMEKLLEAFLTGFALATVTHFLVFPLSSRKVVLKEMTGYLTLLNGSLKAQTAYMASLETVDPVKLKEQHEKEVEDAKQAHHKSKKQPTILETPALLKLREIQDKLLALHGKIDGDLTSAKREVAIGKLESHDFTQLWKHMRKIFLPVMGLLSMVTILERQAEYQGWAEKEGTEEELGRRHHQLDNLRFLLKELHEPFSSMVETLDGAFNHILLTLELVKPPKKKPSDEESGGDDSAKPGTPGFAEAYKKKIEGFYSSKQQTLRDWAHQHGIELPPDFFDTSFVRPEHLTIRDENVRERNQKQLFFVLYLEYALFRIGTSVLDLVVFVDKRKQDGVFQRTKVIFPGSKTIYKWVKATLGREDYSEESSYTMDMESGGRQSIYLDETFDKKRDPEHLPPQNRAEKLGNAVGRIPHFFRSSSSLFGLRVVAATMTIAIVCYLSATQVWFLEQRLLWAVIILSISMTTTAGQSFFNFILRVAGTAAATIGSYIVWYIVDGKKPGVIVFLWLWIFLNYYVVFKYPKLAVVGILSLVTAVLIIGYELQVKTIGVDIVTQNGQPAYPTYELAPYRLATVAGGLFIAFFWTIFPFPVSESSELRRDISASLYLMSSFYSVIHETVKMRVLNTGGDPNTKGTHAYHLEKARIALFSKQIRLINALQTNSAFSKFQIPLGGRFPREEYEELIACLRRLMLWTSLASFCSQTYERSDLEGVAMSEWSADFRQLLSNVNITSNRITSLLSLLSSSLSNGQPLPPHLDMPEPFQFLKRLEALDRDILDIRHIAEPEYSAFAVMQIVSQGISTDVVTCTTIVKKLVGEIDFSYHGMESGFSSTDASSTDLADDEKDKIQ